MHTAVYDPVRDRMIVIGGYDKIKDLLNDVWALSLSGTPTWMQLTPAGTPPTGRHLHSAIYDPVRDRVVIFGGLERSNPGYVNDVWALSLAGSPSWTQLAPVGTPPSTRAMHTAIYDAAHDRMIVFGGFHSGFRGVDAGYLNDVWALSLSGSPTWTQLAPASTPPPSRTGSSAIYVPGRARMVVFGGFNGGNLGDVWELSLAGKTVWRELKPSGTAPGPRQEHAATYDPVGDRMLVVGGYGDVPLNDVWALSLSGRLTWSQVTTQGAEPVARSGHTAIYAASRHQVVVFGGTPDGVSLLGDVWGLSLAGTTNWANLTPAVSPGGRRSHTAIYDPVRDRMLVFGGANESREDVNDVWALSMSSYPVWTQLAPTGTPPSVREGHTAIYDPVRDRMIVYGGVNQLSSFGDVWALSLAGTPSWERVTPAGTPPSVREGHTAIYDPVRDRMVVYGGVSTTSYLGDVWALSLASNVSWTHLTPTGTPPSARFGHSAIYDPIRDRMVVFGGLNGYAFLNEVWALSLAGSASWTQLLPTGQVPAGSEGHTAIYDPTRDRMVVYGAVRDEVHALSFAGNLEWTLLAPTGEAPASRYLHSAIYDPPRDRMVVFGGYQSLYDVWSLDWAPIPAPSVVVEPVSTPSVAYPNPSRGDVTIAFTLEHAGEASVRVYDAAGRVVRTLFSGTLPVGPQSFRWDRRAATGRAVEPGLYFYEVAAKGQRSVRRLALISQGP